MKKLSWSLVISACVMYGASAFASGGYASIAYSESTGTWGEDHGGVTLGISEQEALSSCGYSDCAIVATVYNGYVALATGSNHRYGWATGASQVEATSKALNSCASVAPDCQVRVWADAYAI